MDPDFLVEYESLMISNVKFLPSFTFFPGSGVLLAQRSHSTPSAPKPQLCSLPSFDPGLEGTLRVLRLLPRNLSFWHLSMVSFTFSKHLPVKHSLRFTFSRLLPVKHSLHFLQASSSKAFLSLSPGTHLSITVPGPGGCLEMKMFSWGSSVPEATHLKRAVLIQIFQRASYSLQ